MQELEYPFDSEFIIRKKKSIKKELLLHYEKNNISMMKKKIAILGGSTTNDIKDCLELFLLNYGIEGEFYQCDYGKYWEDIMFDNPKLDMFAPDIIYIHTSNKNINEWPTLCDNEKEIENKLNNLYGQFVAMWQKINEKYKAIIIQNNMEMPGFRLLGNMEAWNVHGKVSFVNRINDKFYEYARSHSDFYINDINYLSASVGLDVWDDLSCWYLYKYALSLKAIPVLCHNLANIIKAVYGKNKKAFVLDLDNTLWGGVISEDGLEGIRLGPDTAEGQAYSDFQKYIKEHKDLGVMLNVCSKNDEAIGKEGFLNPYTILSYEDFLTFKANWCEKNINIGDMAKDINILTESFVFVDDNPMERELVKSQMPEVAVPPISAVERYIKEIDKHGYFECVSLSDDDMKRNEMYQSNVKRNEEQRKFTDYKEFLCSLEMEAEIKNITEKEIERATQLANKCNQFNLTGKKITVDELKTFGVEGENIALYGKLKDKFGDNGIVTVLLGRVIDDSCIIDLWVMSCRVLKRELEHAIIDVLVEKCRKKGCKKIIGNYVQTAKNTMVKDLYENLGFYKKTDKENFWEFIIDDRYINKNNIIKMED